MLARPLNRALVLVVEDEALIRLTLTFMLEDAGYQVVAHETADAAWEWLRSRPDHLPWMLVTDIKMPGCMDGLQLAQAVQMGFVGMRVIITSGHLVVLPDTLAPGAAILPKPYTADTLVQALERMASD